MPACRNSVFLVNDDESGLHHDYEVWLERLAPPAPISQYRHNDTGEELVCNVPNRGALEGIEDDAVVEVVCRVGRKGARPLRVGPIPLAFRGLVQAVKAYETLTVQAAVKKSKRLARQALVNHPLCGDLDVIEPLVDEMLKAHRLRLR